MAHHKFIFIASDIDFISSIIPGTGSHALMVNPSLQGGRPTMFIAGNDEKAKKEITSLAENLGWKSIIDMGDISQSYWLEALAMIWINYGFKNNNWTHAFKLLKN